MLNFIQSSDAEQFSMNEFSVLPNTENLLDNYYNIQLVQLDIDKCSLLNIRFICDEKLYLVLSDILRLL